MNTTAQAHTQYKEASIKREEGCDLLKEKNIDKEKPLKEFKSGIEILGNLYQSPNLIDETEMKLILVENSYNNGKLDEATALYKRILESRISVYEVRFHLKPKK